VTERSRLRRPSTSAEKMRRHRERRRRGISCVSAQLRLSEVDALIACRLLEPAERRSQGLSGSAPSIPRSLPDCRRPTVTRNERVTLSRASYLAAM
jgi:hypothetical protein